VVFNRKQAKCSFLLNFYPQRSSRKTNSVEKAGEQAMKAIGFSTEKQNSFSFCGKNAICFQQNSPSQKTSVEEQF